MKYSTRWHFHFNTTSMDEGYKVVYFGLNQEALKVLQSKVKKSLSFLHVFRLPPDSYNKHHLVLRFLAHFYLMPWKEYIFYKLFIRCFVVAAEKKVEKFLRIPRKSAVCQSDSVEYSENFSFARNHVFQGYGSSLKLDVTAGLFLEFLFLRFFLLRFGRV